MPLAIKLMVIVVHLRNLSFGKPDFLLSKYYLANKVPNLPSQSTEEISTLVSHLTKWRLLEERKTNGKLYEISRGKAVEYSRMPVEEYLGKFLEDLR